MLLKTFRLLVKKMPFPALSQLGLKVIFLKAVCGCAEVIKELETNISLLPESLER